MCYGGVRRVPMIRWMGVNPSLQLRSRYRPTDLSWDSISRDVHIPTNRSPVTSYQTTECWQQQACEPVSDSGHYHSPMGVPFWVYEMYPIDWLLPRHHRSLILSEGNQTSSQQFRELIFGFGNLTHDVVCHSNNILSSFF